MLHFSRWKIITILVTCLLGLVAVLPNFLSQQTLDQFPRFLPKSKIGLGLDLRGGAHLLTTMDMDELRRDWLLHITDDARKRLREAKIGYTALGAAGGAVQVRLNRPEDVEPALKALRPMVQPLAGSAFTGLSGGDLDVRRDNQAITIVPTDQALQARATQAIATAIETIRRRLDPNGNREVTIQRQGADRILIQEPGVEDTGPTKALIQQAAKLTFHLLHPTMGPEDIKGPKPPGYEVYPDMKQPGVTYLLNRIPIVTGEELADAQPSFDQRTNEPVVTFRFNQSGARKFGKVTSENVNRPFAMVLDGKVISAPVIREPILGGTGQISGGTGGFSPQETNEMSILLRSGALPAKLTVVEERVVGASLGEDSIKAGQRAAMIGTVAVIVFMLFAYGFFGLFAVIAVALNVLFIIGLMSLMGSTLTLPGIAGIVLTIGMAVDANVLIYERMREELRNGKSTIAALDAGFDRAFGTIIDANLTTLIAGLVMFWLGSGPIRGFAVTLSLGILTTVFTAFTVTRLLVAWWLQAQKSKKIEPPISFRQNKRARASA